MTADRNFDALAERFHRQIYRTDKGRIRTALIKEDIEAQIPWIYNTENSNRSIIDAGGGTGLFSAQLTKNNPHHVTLCDISKEMLSRAQQNYQDIAPKTPVEFIHEPIQNLPDHVSQPADLILFHAVIEWLENPREVLRSLSTLVKPGGWFSVLFYNRQSLIWRHLVMGNFNYTNDPDANLKGNGKTLTPDNPQNPENVKQWLLEVGFEIKAHTGIRSVYDNMRSHDRIRSSFTDIMKAEQLYGRQKPYQDIARYIHFLCKKTL